MALTAADLAASDDASGPASLVYSVANAANGHVALRGALGATVTSFTQAQLAAGNVFFVHDGSNTTTGGFGVTVADGHGGRAGPVTVGATVTSANHAPVVSGDLAISLAEGGNVALTTADLATSDDESGPAALAYTVANAAHGHVALQGALATTVTSFTQAQLAAGNVFFVHDGSNTATGGFDVTVADGDGGEAGPVKVSATVTIQNDAPAVSGDLAITVIKGGSVALTSADLAASDEESGPTALVYSVANAANGYLALQGALGTPITTFTQAQLTAGIVFFEHDGSSTTTGGFAVTVADGDGGSAGPVTVSATVTQPNASPSGAPAISDTSPTEGQVLTAATGTIADPDGINSDFSYQWQSLVGAVWTDIGGAQSETFSPVQAQVNSQIRVLASFTDGGGTLETLASDPTVRGRRSLPVD